MTYRRAQVSRPRGLALGPPQRPYLASAWSSTRTHERPPDHLEDRQRRTCTRLSRFSEWYQVVSSGRWMCLDDHVRKDSLRRAEQSVTRSSVHVPGLGCHATCESEDEVLVGSNGRWVEHPQKHSITRCMRLQYADQPCGSTSGIGAFSSNFILWTRTGWRKSETGTEEAV